MKMTTMNMTLSDFSAKIEEEIAKLIYWKRTLFAACCAERLLPTYMDFANKTAIPDEQKNVYRKALDKIWDSPINDLKEKKYWEEVDALCERLIPEVDFLASLGFLNPENAAAAATFAIWSYIHDDIKNAFYASQRVTDAIDSYVCMLDPSYYSLSDYQIEQNVLMLAEVKRQFFDIQQLETIQSPISGASIINQMKERAQHDALIIFA